jgi:predicted AlkP superfamily pyrophosphatase or phosphodiesterase
MKKILLVVLLASSSFIQAQNSLPRPKLVVGIVIDQMRWDYIYRYYDRYGQGGFKRMLGEGFTCENTYIDYVPTVTAIGHTTIYTGSVPAIHGIAGNDFIINQTGISVYCTDDTTVQTVGSNSKEGQMSPRNLLASTITDELKLATNSRSKVIGIALKDRASILPAGHRPDAAYWFDNASGNWITSTYYMQALPAWLDQFNARRLAEKYLKQDWNTLYPIATYIQSSPDDNPYEGKFAGQSTPTFPIHFTQGTNFDLIRTTPYGNTMTLELAQAAVENEKLGQRNVTDFLAVSCSSTDYIGHKFGPNSIEVEDTYLRLDRDLATFFTFLDKQLGKGNYTVFLSADHGAANNAGFLADQKIPAGYWQSGQALKQLNTLLNANYKTANLVLSLSNYQVHLNYPEIKKNHLDEQAIRKDCVDFLTAQPNMAFVVDAKNIEAAAVPQELKERIINGYHPDRSGSITFVLEPGWYSGTLKGTGTTHGSWNAYDAHIPLLWMGWGIRHGSTVRQTGMTDIAPTLAALLHIQAPNGSIGKAIPELIKAL